MADVILRFRLTDTGETDLGDYFGFAHSASLMQPTPLCDLTVPDGTPDGVAVATEGMVALGWTLIDTDPSTTIIEAARAQLFSVDKLRETDGPTDLAIGAVEDTQLFIRSGTTAVGVPRRDVGSSVHSFGADMGSTGEYMKAHGDSEASSQGSLDELSEVTMPAAGTFDRASWRKGDSGDATMKVIDNGVVVETFTASGVEGSVALTGTAFTAGTPVAIEYDAGDAPGKGTVELHTGAA